MKRLNLRWPVLALLLALPTAFLPFNANTAFAQSSTSGSIVGTVTDPTGAFIPGATVTIVDPTTKATRSTVSNAKGQYILPNVQPGNYNITSTKNGFSTDEVTGITIGVGAQFTANFKMAVGAESTTVEVTTSGSDLQTMSATTGATVDPALVTNLPAISREVSSFLTLQPGVTPGGNVAGTTTDQVSFSLDGGANTSDMDGTNNVYTAASSTANGTVSSTTGGATSASTVGVMPMPQDSVEEFKVSTTGQTADFNNSSGGQTQVVTKRGRDKITGTVYEYYLDNNLNANTWQNNFPASIGYTKKTPYHYSRFGAAAGGPIAPYFLGGKTYIFGNYEGFRYPNFATYERTIPSYSYLNTGLTDTFDSVHTAYSANTLQTVDSRHIGLNPTLAAFYASQLPLAPASGTGSTGANGTVYPGIFDSSCAGGASSTYCDQTNTIGYKGNVSLPEKSNFLALRLDHDFGAKWHFMASYRYYKLSRTTTNQVSICGAIGTSGPCNGQFVAATNRPQVPWFGVVGLTTNISTSLTNDFHYSYLRNLWQYAGPGDPPQVAGAAAAIEPFGDQTNNVMSPYNIDSQDTRTRTWDGKDNFFSDNVTKLKGDHLIQVGGQYQHNFNYHLRTDNGASINYQPLYLLGDPTGAGNIAFTQGIPGTSNANWNRDLATYYGLVTDTQVLNTYQNVAGVLTKQPAGTAYAASTTIPYYNIYATDTWHVKPSITINAGISYALEMPPTERYGQQAMLTDAAGNATYVDNYLAARQAAALAGTVYEPQLGFALVHNTVGARKYAYDPFYAGVSPRISASWNPKFKTKTLDTIFGHGATVIRGGYGRIYGRLNGDVEVLNPLLSPPIILATQCQYLQTAAAVGGSAPACLNNGAFNDGTVARFGATSSGLDGLSFATASAVLPTTVGNVYRPGIDGPGIANASPDDPSLRPNDVDTINFSIQRQINRRSLVEVGYIGRLIHHEYQYLNNNTVPYMMTLGGQSFESAYVAIEKALGCTTSSTLCATNTKLASNGTTTTPGLSVAAQPFIEAALGGSGSNYCSAYAGSVTGTQGACTNALLKKQSSNLGSQSVFNLWKALDNNSNGTSAAGGFVFGRSLAGTPTSPTGTFGSAGQIVSGTTMATGQGYGNYHGGYVSYKISGLHGFTLQENLTFSKTLGLDSVTQSSSGVTAQDSFNLSQQYGKQPFDQKLIFNTFIVYETPWYKNQHGVVGRLAGGWTLSPVVAAGTGQPQTCSTNNSGQSFGGADGTSSTNDPESCIFTQKYSGGYHTHRGVFGGPDAAGTNVGTSVHAGGPGAAVNEFKSPAAVYDSTRPAILGFDPKDAAAGTFQGLPYLNLDMSVKKNLVVYKTYSLELSGVFSNVLNHMEFSNPSLAINNAAAFGVIKTQGNSPRTMQMGVRAYF